MAWRIDWKRIHNEWDKAPSELRETTKSLLKEMPYDELEKLFKQSPDAKAVYEKVIGKWVPPAEWSRELERYLRDVFSATLTRGLPDEGIKGISPTRYLPEFRDELSHIKTLRTEEEMRRYVEGLAKEILRREIVPIVKPVILPPVLEVCPIDKTSLEILEKVPIRGPVRLSKEEEDFLKMISWGIPIAEIVWVDVPPTIKVWTCQEKPFPHYFERDARGRFVQRTGEYLYKKILRERVRVMRMLAPPVPILAPPTPPRIPVRVKILPKFPEWLMETHKLLYLDWSKMPEAERKRYLAEYMEWIEKHVSDLRDQGLLS